MTDAHLLAPRITPDGTVLWEHEKPEIARRIREGDPALGWLGDPLLSLHLNLTYETPDGVKAVRWEVWRNHDTGVAPTLVCARVAQRIDGDSLIRQLARHDSRTRDMANDLLVARDARAERISADFRESVEEPTDRLAHALGRDLDLPAPSGRLYPLGR